LGLKFVSYTYSTRDLPGKWSLVLFLPYCNFRCKHCHNWQIVLGKEERNLSEEDILKEVEGNPFLQSIVISGGEPTIHKYEDIASFVEKLKNLNPDLIVRIDTNGYEPEILKKLSKVVDGFAVDIKAPPSNTVLYSFTAGTEVDTERIIESIRVADEMPYTVFRTPAYPWLKEEDIEKLRDFTSSLSSPWSLNEFVEIPECPFNLR